MKPPDCTCQYPRVRFRNGHGHAEDCAFALRIKLEEPLRRQLVEALKDAIWEAQSNWTPIGQTAESLIGKLNVYTK
jgi:hypothetical protein